MSGRESLARVTFAATSAVCLVGATAFMWAAVADEDGRFATPVGRLLDSLGQYTILTNLLAGATTAVLAAGMGRGRTFDALRLAGVVNISLSAIVFHLAVDLGPLNALASLGSLLTHTVAPLMVVAGWAAFGPRERVDAGTVRLSLTFPIAYLVATMIRGELVVDRFGQATYPADILNPEVFGYPIALANALGTVLLLFLLTWLARTTDRLLSE